MRSVPLHDVSEIRRLFDKTDLDAVVVLSPRSLWCLTGAARAFARRPGYRRNSCAIAFRDAEPILITGRFQEEPSLIFSWINDITTYSDYLESPLTRAAEVLNSRGLAAGKIGVEAHAHTTEFYDDLVAGLDGATLVPCDNLLDMIWSVKQREEIEVLADNLQRMSAEIGAVISQSKEGETEDAVHKRILASMRRTGTASVWGTLVSGERLPALRGLPGERALATGDLFRIDYSYTRRNYPARVCRMGIVGSVNASQHTSYKRFIEAITTAVSQIGPGQTGQQIYRIVVSALDKASIEAAGPSFGNTLGIGMYLERPVIHAEEVFETRPGMVLSIEPATSAGYKVNQEIEITESGNELIASDSLLPLDDLLTISS